MHIHTEVFIYTLPVLTSFSIHITFQSLPHLAAEITSVFMTG